MFLNSPSNNRELNCKSWVCRRKKILNKGKYNTLSG